MTTPHCPEETTDKTADCSPGLVAGEEMIVLLLFDPETIQAGVLTPTAISRKRLKDGDFSVARAAHVPSAVAQRVIIDGRLAKDAKLKYAGAVKALAADIRNAGVSQAAPRLFCVYDDPVKPDLCGHAIIAFSNITRDGKFWGPKKNDALAAVGNLLRVFEKNGVPLSIADCFTG